MGMDYQFAGSASYPRFNDEVKGIVELFGGKLNMYRKPKEKCTMVEYFMEEPLKYKYPHNFPFVLKKWANDPYGKFTAKETKKIYKVLLTKEEEVKNISGQILEEFKCCVIYNEAWQIS